MNRNESAISIMNTLQRIHVAWIWQLDAGTSNATPWSILRTQKHCTLNTFFIFFYKQFTSKCVLTIATHYTLSSSWELSLVTGSLLSVWIISWECVTRWPKVLPAPLLALLWALYSACLICSTCGCFLVPSSAEVKVNAGRHLESKCFAHTWEGKVQREK